MNKATCLCGLSAHVSFDVIGLILVVGYGIVRFCEVLKFFAKKI
jgi:hypothetical protein